MESQADRYRKFYSEKWLERYSFWHELMETMIDSEVGAIVEALKSIEKKKVNILDVGCGIGDVTNRALEELNKKEIRLVGIDTSEEALKKYAVVNEKYKPKIILHTMEQLPENSASKFDLILFSHSLYGVLLDGLFERYITMLNEGGSILIFLTSHDSDTIKISKKFWKKVYGREYDETLAEDVIEKLESLKLNYAVKEFKQEVDFDKLREIKSSGVKDLFVPFLFRMEDFKERNEIGGYVEGLSKKKKIYNLMKAILVRKS